MARFSFPDGGNVVELDPLWIARKPYVMHNLTGDRQMLFQGPWAIWTLGQCMPKYCLGPALPLHLLEQHQVHRFSLWLKSSCQLEENSCSCTRVEPGHIAHSHGHWTKLTQLHSSLHCRWVMALVYHYFYSMCLSRLPNTNHYSFLSTWSNQLSKCPKILSNQSNLIDLADSSHISPLHSVISSPFTTAPSSPVQITLELWRHMTSHVLLHSIIFY
jgi:hypothetical protein